MKNVLKVNYDDLIIKSYKYIKNTDNDYFDLDRNFNLNRELEERKSKSNYSVIIYELNIRNTIIKLISPKLEIDMDNLKIKLYLQGFVNIRHEKNFTSYYYELGFLN